MPRGIEAGAGGGISLAGHSRSHLSLTAQRVANLGYPTSSKNNPRHTVDIVRQHWALRAQEGQGRPFGRWDTWSRRDRDGVGDTLEMR